MTSYILFAIFWMAILYGLNCLIAGKVKKVDIKQAILYATTVAMVGVYGEVFLDTVYNWVVGQPLWYYNVLPIHGGYTSLYAPIVWGLYGFHLYMLHETLKTNWSIERSRYLALILCVEALILEALLTISAKPFFGDFMYYYTPGDLWHVTSVQNIPFYFVCGLVIVALIQRFKRDPWFFSALSTFFVVLLVFLV